jgi:protein-S-isoprenylcysteine O-methyltransferase Ste14
VRTFFKKHWQLLLNIYLFANLAGWLVWDAHKSWVEHRLGFIEISFMVHNAFWIGMVLVRRQHLAVDRNVLHQIVALTAFFSGLAMPIAGQSGNPLALDVSGWFILVALVLSVATIFNLGRSFGILIAVRKVQTGGLYRVIRHPMYATDILLRVGYIVSHFTLLNLGIVVASALCYGYRAVLEERFLSQWPEYQEYRERVRYRFIPGVF